MNTRSIGRALTSFVAAVGMMCSLAPSAFGQSRATGADLAGHVHDQTQGAMADVRIVARNQATSVERSTTTDGRGRFSIPLLPPGSYEVIVESSGFTTEVRIVILEVGAVLDLDVVLAVAPTAETVRVIAENPIIDLRKTATANLVSRLQIERLPIDVRNFVSFAAITPGVTVDHTPQQGASATSGLTFAGQRARSNNLTVDGLDNNDSAAGGVRATFSQDAVQEFQVLANSFPAEFGNAAGGVVNIVTKSGTNTVASGAFLFLRDETLNAKGHFERVDPFGNAVGLQRAPYTQQQFGATVGGPIRRNTTFFFGSYERLDIAASNLVTIDDRTPVLHPFLRTPLGTPAQILRHAGFAVETGHVMYDRTIDQGLARIDRHFGSGQTLTLRVRGTGTLDENVEPFGGITARSRAAALDASHYAAAASQTSVLSSRWLNELRFEAAYHEQLVRALDPACGGPCLRSDQGGPTLEVVGVASIGRQRYTPQNRTGMTYQLLDTASYHRGSHVLKAGADFIIRDNRVTASVLPLHFGGRYIFAPLPAVPGVLPLPVSSIQAVALGLPAAYIQGYGRDHEQLDYRDLALFVQDDWRPSPRVTVRYGARYQYQQWADVPHRITGYSDMYRFPTDRNDFAPRVAAAWNIAGDRKTTIHGAYGIFHDKQIRAVQTVPVILDGNAHVRTLVARFPSPLVAAAWNAPGHRLPEASAGAFPSLEFAVDPDLRTPYAHHVSAGLDHELVAALRLSANFIRVRGFNQVGTIDYNPQIPSLGANRRPLDVNGVPGTSASVLQYTSFGETWYSGVVLALDKRYGERHQWMASYTLSKAEDSSTDFQSAFMPQQNGRGRDQANPAGVPIAFDPRSERGPSTQDQRHRFVFSGFFSAPGRVMASSIITIASGRPYTVLAGADLNGDGDGGAFPPDRARRSPADEATSVGRNSATAPAQLVVDVRISRRFSRGRVAVEGVCDAFNLFNRTNFVETNNTSSAFVFGTGRYPEEPLPAFGRFTQAGPPRQVQFGLRLSF